MDEPYMNIDEWKPLVSLDYTSYVCPHLEIIHKEHGHLPHTEEDGADSDHQDQVGVVGVRLILLSLGLTQQLGQETVPLVDFKALTRNFIWIEDSVFDPPVYQRGTSITRETRMFRERAQAISMFVLRNLLLYSGTVWTPSSQSWYGEARLKG